MRGPPYTGGFESRPFYPHIYKYNVTKKARDIKNGVILVT